jgi:hypothetical protein
VKREELLNPTQVLIISLIDNEEIRDELTRKNLLNLDSSGRIVKTSKGGSFFPGPDEKSDDQSDSHAVQVNGLGEPNSQGLPRLENIGPTSTVSQ